MLPLIPFKILSLALNTLILSALPLSGAVLEIFFSMFKRYRRKNKVNAAAQERLAS